jgi:hypothetical protein
LKRQRNSQTSTSVGRGATIMIEERDVKDRLAAVAERKLPLGEFGDWLEAASRNMHLDSSPAAIDLVSSIHLLFSEYEHGDLNESELRHELLALIGDLMVLSFHIKVDVTVTVRPTEHSSRFTSMAWADVEAGARVPA